MKTLMFLLMAIFFSTGCCRYWAEISYYPTTNTYEGLAAGSLSGVNRDSQKLVYTSGRNQIENFREVPSMLKYNNQKITFEEYLSWNRYKPNCIHSDAKSVTSLCIGIALDKGLIKTVDQSIFDYLPNHQHLRTKEKEKITIEHLLTMTSGLEWEEWEILPGKSGNDAIAIWYDEEGPVNYVLEKPVVHDPGTHFNYSGGDIQILAEVLRNASGMTLDKFSEKYLLEPLWIKSNDLWMVFPNGEIQAAEGLTLLPGDMAKIEKLILNRGTFNGDRIVSEKWIDKCVTVGNNPGRLYNASLF